MVNKAELIDTLTEKLGSDRRHATAAVENFVDTVVRAVQKGESVTITGFGAKDNSRTADAQDVSLSDGMVMHLGTEANPGYVLGGSSR